MFGNVIGILIALLVAVGLGWLVTRAWQAGNPILKWAGVVLGGLLTLLAGLITVLSIVGFAKFVAPRGSPVEDLQVELTPERVARGEHLAAAFCASCHSATGDLPLTGGLDLGADIPIPLGSFYSANLTPAGSLAAYSDGELKRVLREGVDRNGRGLLMMGIVRARYLGDEDLYSVMAYLRSQPAIENPAVPAQLDQPSFLGLVMNGAGMLPPPQPPVTGSITAPPKGETVAYGEYLISFQDCRDCHGEDLRGGVEGQLAPIGPNLSAVKTWSAEQFIATMRTGVNPDGHELSAAMPWREIGRLDDVELTAMHMYLASLP